jgi:tetratricopeptide (TPR) repeat protein
VDDYVSSPFPFRRCSTSRPTRLAFGPRPADVRANDSQRLAHSFDERGECQTDHPAQRLGRHDCRLHQEDGGALVLRASIYCQKKEWDLAEADFRTAAKIAPTNAVLKFNLIEVKFMQKQYDVARPGFLALEKDPDVLKGDPEMVDFAQYKVFLCDLFGGHLDVAKKELDVFNDAMGNPSYYFANAAWDLVHHNIEGARSWLLSASRIYAPRKNAYYSQSLRDTGYLPIPEPPAAQ